MSNKDNSLASLLPAVTTAMSVQPAAPAPAAAPKSKPAPKEDTHSEPVCWLMTSEATTVEITFTYNTDGFLESLHISESMPVKNYEWLLANMPYHTAAFNDFRAVCKPATTFVRKKREVTFQMFWDRYNDKERSSKKKTEVAWHKLSEANQLKAYLYVPVYNRKRGSAEKKYATTYLSDELWNN